MRLHGGFNDVRFKKFSLLNTHFILFRNLHNHLRMFLKKKPNVLQQQQQNESVLSLRQLVLKLKFKIGQ